MDFAALRARLADTAALRPVGSVRSVTGLSVRLMLPGARIGDVVLIRRRGEPLLAEVVGFEAGEAVAVPLGELTGVGPDDRVESTGGPLHVLAGSGLLGCVLDGIGNLVAGQPRADDLVRVPIDRPPPPALTRKPVAAPLATGIRAIDGLMTLGVGQRVGLFAGSGVGKSTLLGAIARGTSADVVVVGLIGERGREVSEFLEHSLGSQARERSVVVVATSDAPALERLRAAQVATAFAEHFRDQGQSVLLLLDSITRVARAQREVGLAAGEPPVRRGYPPSVFALLPRLLERSGQSAAGAITAIYTILVEGGDMDEPIADEVRGILDGHVILERTLAARGHFPAIDVGASLSRVMGAVVSREHAEAARQLRESQAVYEEKRDLIALGGYAKGSDARVDHALRVQPQIEQFLRQPADETCRFEDTLSALRKVAAV
ncbi:MAG TPA: FliI/YscN family ATPase [Polyangiaceae bacterium]